MPTYDYVCDACQHQFELYQRITEDTKRKCPECGKTKLRRLIGGGAAILFKGSGFYTTDYRSDSYKKAAEADKKPAEPKDSAAKDSAAKESSAKDSAAKNSSGTGKKSAGDKSAGKSGSKSHD